MLSGEKIHFTARHARMIACDSDGCVFDVMDLKQKECFCPAFIKHFNLHDHARLARETWERVNLRSHSRGCNRFKAVSLALAQLEASASLSPGMDFTRLHRFAATVGTLDEQTLARAAWETRDTALQAMLDWTREVNSAVETICHNTGPFAGAAETLRAMAAVADIVVVSQAPHATVRDEWARADLSRDTAFIAGQEYGTKPAQIRQAMEDRYTPQRVLVLGDAPGDLEAAREIMAAFFPIIPGREIESWQNLLREVLPAFISDAFTDSCQVKLCADFTTALS